MSEDLTQNVAGAGGFRSPFPVTTPTTYAPHGNMNQNNAAATYEGYPRDGSYGLESTVQQSNSWSVDGSEKGEHSAQNLHLSRSSHTNSYDEYNSYGSDGKCNN